MDKYIKFMLQEAAEGGEGNAGGGSGGNDIPGVPDALKQRLGQLKDTETGQAGLVKDEDPSDPSKGEGGKGDEGSDGGDSPSEINLDEYTNEELDAIEAKDEKDLTEEDKLVLAALEKEAQEQGDEGEGGEESQGGEILSEEDYNKILEKNEDDWTDEELAQVEAYEAENSTINLAKKAIGIPELQERDYPNTSEGVTQLINDAVQERQNDVVADFLEQAPAIKSLYDHLSGGMSVETWLMENQAKDYSTFNLKEEDGQIQMLKYAYEQKGLNKEEIDQLIEVHKNTGKLEAKSKDEFKLLQARDKEAAAKAKEEEARIAQQQQVETQKMIDEYNKAVSARQLLGRKLTRQESQQLIDFTYKVDEQTGRPLSEIAYINSTPEQKAFINYMLMNQFKVNGIEPKEIKQGELNRQGRRNRRRSKNNAGQSKGSSKSGQSLGGKSIKDFL